MAHVSFCAFSLSDGMESDRCVTSVLCLGRVISPTRRYCVPPHLKGAGVGDHFTTRRYCVPPHLKGAGAGDQSVLPRPGSLFPARWGGVGTLIGLVPMTCCPSLSGMGGGDSG